MEQRSVVTGDAGRAGDIQGRVEQALGAARGRLRVVIQ